ncbi:glycine zipper domain-containing protein [Sphingopyxis terrae]|uniref:glycine zipper domain-containing protein n=1 Tax=Sphingopyxis terrae TaxID=33052 RepID=UPI0009ECDEF7|nr:glycine zipper domain-containing protein [Sphingopyxis terrae]
MRKCGHMAVALAAIVSLTLPTGAAAQSWGWHDRSGDEWYDGYGDGRDDGYEDGRDDGYDHGWREGWHDRGRHARETAYYDDEDDYRSYHHCRRRSGTGGLIVGALAGGLLGREVARDRGAGTIIGGGVGALAGRAIDRGQNRC